MKNKFVLIGLLLGGVFSSCGKEVEGIEPLGAVSVSSVQAVTYPLEFRVKDNSSGTPVMFNTTLRGDVFYFPETTSEAEIRAFFGNPSAHDEWNPREGEAQDVIEVENEVGLVGFSGNPGYFIREFQLRKKVVVIWHFLESVEEVPMSDRTVFANYGLLGDGADNKDIIVNRQFAEI